MHDLVIRGATVVDGLGHDPIRADVAVDAGKIAAIGNVKDAARETVEAPRIGDILPGKLKQRARPAAVNRCGTAVACSDSCRRPAGIKHPRVDRA